MSISTPGTVSRIACVAIAMILSALTARAENDDRFAHGAAALKANATSGKSSRTRNVHCEMGRKLSHAIKWANPGDTLRISGTCMESVEIATDRLTLLGVSGAAIDGGKWPSEAVVLIDGARRVSLIGLDVRNGSDQGVLATRGAQVRLQRVRMHANTTVGLSVDRSHVEIHDVAMDNNGTGGMDAYSASTVVASGSISAVGNSGDGLAANGKTFFELRGAEVVANDNAGSGVSIINDSRLQIFSFPEAQGSSITANGNGFAGIGVLGAEVGIVGSEFFGSGANVLSASNNLFGFFMPAGAILSPHATARFVASGNAIGMLMEDGASALIIGGLDLAQNGTGLSAIGAGTLTLVSVPPNPASISGNQQDVDLGFGTRATIDDVAHTSIACDATVLLRGSATCPGT